MSIIDKQVYEKLWHNIRSNPNDLREMGLSVDVHNDYKNNGEKFTYWQMSFLPNSGTLHPIRQALVGEGKTDEEALDKIRALYAEITDKLHHAPMCPANHYHGMRAPTGECSCGAKQAEGK